jgi:hypothetical protein
METVRCEVCGEECSCMQLEMELLFGDEVIYPTCTADEKCEACQ